MEGGELYARGVGGRGGGKGSMIEEGQCAALTGGVVLGREIVPRVPARAQREKPKRRVGAKTQSWRGRWRDMWKRSVVQMRKQLGIMQTRSQHMR